VLSDLVVVVPCYNEAKRLKADAFLRLASAPGVRVLFVNDGSRDDTEAKLREIEARNPARIAWLSLEKNSGKAEAVRRGMEHALKGASPPDAIGYYDADLSTPPEELVRMWSIMRERQPDVSVVLASRIAILGSNIDRKAVRHYLGRVFATFASIILGLPVYDTQCGAKLFRVTPSLRAAVSEKFLSRWAFDVELLGRLLAGTPPVPASEWLEVPLLEWNDVPGSKLQPISMAKTLAELGLIQNDLRRRRRR
jgi:dolichyl-phosphate beta-glucosyltransferase